MTPAYLFVGIDGGATRARAVVTNAEGKVLGRAEGPATLVQPADPTAVAEDLARLAARAVDHVQRSGSTVPTRPAALCCALAGAGREPARALVEERLRGLDPAERVLVVTDAEAALEDAFGQGPGLLLIAGTGSIAWARAEDGRVARAGGWGTTLGDEGSAYALGHGALRAIARAHDGRGPATAMTAAVLRHTGGDAPERLVDWAGSAGKREIAALARIVTAAALAGDGEAGKLVRQAIADLVAHIAALHRRLRPWSRVPTLAMSGALIAPGGPIRTPLLEAVRAAGIPFAELDRDVDAAAGAAALARAAAASDR